ncbi:protein-L-isoaspartate O-methyltransferase [Sphingomonas crocodyli]|uniref:Protein-L-isoaspartate O-methyltransferase n=2 Tax=Sphingomonas crocodyli TaxID=1979270 RepID=A0A437LVX0_9SPHN|nr:protein-L-isoaspartate O-methyltransferase [Sphingomonas crocodyli]
MVVSQLRTTGVSDATVVAAMGRVAREGFVPADKAPLAYLDIAVPLGGGRALNPPMVTGRLLTAAQIQPGDRVLLIGAATGYVAALLIALGASVVAVEDDAALVAQGRANVAGAEWVEGSLTAGASASAPYDVIVVDGAIEQIPASLTDQLAEGGRFVGAIVENGVVRLVSGARGGAGFGYRAFADADAVVLPGFARPAAFQF